MVSGLLNRRNFLHRTGLAGFLAVAGASCERPVEMISSKKTNSLPKMTTSSNQKQRTAFIIDDDYKKHITGTGHPEQPGRIDAIARSISAAKFDRQLLRVSPRRASEAELLTCHSQSYLDSIKQDVSQGALQLRTGDTTICADSLDVALLSSGGVLQAIDGVFRGEYQNAFCAIRPPGHHATSSRGMGFCLLNNAAIAARYAQRKHGVDKVLIVDWDVHHGNGTQDIFYDDGSVFYFSTHQSPWYPGTGAADETGTGKGLGTTLNVPLPAGSGEKKIFAAFHQKLLPEMERFKPDLVIISAGFDSRIGDPLGQFTLDDEDFANLTRLLLDLAGRHSQDHLVSVLEGGYHLEGLGSAVASHLQALSQPS